jgi:hypothetical protein
VENGETKWEVGRAIEIILAERHEEGDLLNSVWP